MSRCEKSARSKRLDEGEDVPLESLTEGGDDRREGPPALSDDDTTALTDTTDQ